MTRLDVFLSKKFCDLTRSQIKRYIEGGYVKVNNMVVNRPSLDISNEEEIDFIPPKVNDFTLEINQFSRNVVYEDDNVIVINKPAGLLVHAKGGICNEFTVEDYVRSKFNHEEVLTNLENNRLGIVHRLDRATSGVMICAKNLATASYLSKQFSERTTHKTYLAIVSQIPKISSARIELPVGRNLSRPSTFKVDAKGKAAITDYKIIHVNDDGTALVELKPQTGRTHQLRVHMAYIGCPIVGDQVYGNDKLKSNSRLMLHAWKLEISIPGKKENERRVFVADPPKEFEYGL